MKEMASAVRALISVLVVGAACFMLFALWALNGHGADLKAYGLVTNGMTTIQVESLLGSPTIESNQ
jgi:outer membrane protein assembly factor BamE (lipoprotein component of BamABCDE complex)